jgi:CysZ protein
MKASTAGSPRSSRATTTAIASATTAIATPPSTRLRCAFHHSAARADFVEVTVISGGGSFWGEWRGAGGRAREGVRAAAAAKIGCHDDSAARWERAAGAQQPATETSSRSLARGHGSDTSHAPSRLARVVRGFVSGVRMLLRGFGYWRRDPGVMLLGLVPAVLVFAGIVAALVALGFGLPALVDWATPFADDWQAGWRTAFRITVGAITFTAAGLLAAVTFTAVTLAVGDPFYERIWRSVELDLGGDVPAEGAGFWRAVVDSLGLIGLGLVAAIVVALVGFIPVVGAVAAPVLGVVLSGRLLAAELSSRALQARGLPADVRRAIRRAHRGELLGFGVATQLCFMIPLGAVFTMPAAVAGSTMLARSALDAVQPAPAVGPVGPAPAAGPAAGPTATDVSAS